MFLRVILSAKPSPFDTERDNITQGVSSVITAMTGGFKSGQSSEPLYVAGDFSSVRSLSNLRIFLGYVLAFVFHSRIFLKSHDSDFLFLWQHSWEIYIAMFGSSIHL
jgi:hypothetical protein